MAAAVATPSLDPLDARRAQRSRATFRAIEHDDPTPHIGQIYNLTGFESADLEHYARVFSEALGRTIRYRDVPLSGWSEKLLGAGVPAHVVKHLSVMTELKRQLLEERQALGGASTAGG